MEPVGHKEKAELLDPGTVKRGHQSLRWNSGGDTTTQVRAALFPPEDIQVSFQALFLSLT